MIIEGAFVQVGDVIPEWSAAARQDGESAAHYRLFLKYLDLGEDRTLAQVAQDAGKHPITVRKLAGRWKWRHRALTREWELDQAEADQLRQGSSVVAAQVVSGAVQQTRQLTRVATEAEPDPNRVPLRDVSSGLRDMAQIAQLTDELAQKRSMRPAPLDVSSHDSDQDAARAALVDALKSPDQAARFQAARVLVDMVQDNAEADLEAVVALLTGAARAEVGEDSSRRLAARIAAPEVTGAEDE